MADEPTKPRAAQSKPKRKRRKKKRYKLNDSWPSAVVKNLRGGVTVTKACDEVGISRVAFYNLLQRDKQFRARVEKAMKSRVSFVVDAMYIVARRGDVTAGKFLLTNWDSENYRNQQHVEARVQQIPPVEFQDAEPDSEEK